jgi:hypothetical protein
MLLSKDQFPITVQAYEITDHKEYFIAEQVVHNQSEVDSFVTRYAGKVIKARPLTSAETTVARSSRRTSSSAGTIILVILIILAILVAIGLYTGWIQRTFNIST